MRYVAWYLAQSPVVAHPAAMGYWVRIVALSLTSGREASKREATISLHA